MRIHFALACLACLGTLAAPPAAWAQPPSTPTAPQLGRWVTESGNLEVEVAPCGEALCGTVVRVLANRSMSAPGSEMTPADPRTVMGMTILSDFRAAGVGEWKGQIYSRENSQHYNANMSLGGPGELVIRAYVGLPLFGKTQVWRRAEQPNAAGAAP